MVVSRRTRLAFFCLAHIAFGAVAASGAPELPAACDAAAVGAGWAGVYYAYRLATSGLKVCLFEGSERIGGRTYSHKLSGLGKRGENFTLDVGAYRFSPDMHLPGDLILDVLKLPVACYEPSCPPPSLDFPPPFHLNYSKPLVRIVDGEGMPAGYVTAIEGMVARIRFAGGKIFTGARLTDYMPATAQRPARLHFGDQAVEVQRALLNLPRPALLGLPTLKASTPARTVKMQECVKFDEPDNMFPSGLGRSVTKAYAFYEDAWWHTRLNRTVGQFPANAFVPANTSEGIPIGIHFNDGPVRCDGALKGCRGFLEVFYSMAPAAFFEGLKPSEDQPLGILGAAPGGQPDAAGKLPMLHAAIMEATAELFAQTKVAKPEDPPTILVVGVWDRTGHGYTAPTKVYYSTSESVPGGPDPLEKACGVPGLTEAEYRSTMLAPLSDPRLLVANNDWVAQTTETFFGDWAEESLLQAERGLRRQGFPRPGWLDLEYYAEKVAALGDEATEVLV